MTFQKKRPKKTPAEVRAERLKDMDFVVFKEKHGKYYFSLIPGDPDRDGRTRVEMWAEICLAVATQRDRDDGAWYPSEEPTIPAQPSPVDPTAPLSVQKCQLNKLESWPTEVRWASEAKVEWELLEKVRKGDKEAAMDLIESRRDHEYEGYDFECFTEPSSLYSTEDDEEED